MSVLVKGIVQVRSDLVGQRVNFPDVCFSEEFFRQGPKCSVSHHNLQCKTTTCVMYSYLCIAKNVIHGPLSFPLGNCYTNYIQITTIANQIGFV